VNAPSRKPAKPKTSAHCPVCGKPTVHEHRPFCSKRCAEIDLGRWLKGGYAVPGQPIDKTGASDDEQD
jgi:endogenous inhibitor of DNA gyrase (YacG/DUF329 family)